ncbi:MAG: type I pullulanase [Oscillospiraceae bacterium]|nr:type I pullulanase [Oscillospiraceae bacterium]
MPSFYSTEDFEAEFTYSADDLGATWTETATTFRVWAPTATNVKINLYETGDPSSPDLIDQVEMTADVNGTWVAKLEGNRHGVYYTYQVDVNGNSVEACDPYARTTGVNGMRAMIIDLDSTDPEGWENDKDPHYDDNITDAIIYELHVRDLSVDASSGITNKGKFLGLIEAGTTNSQGKPTGLDYIKGLGVTHIHLLPSYDYATVDESNLAANEFNWGYDPKNYNVPEGSYSTDPYNGEVRVSEFKQMVKGLHDNGISVIMDVVYNHVYDAKGFCFNQIVPQYFSRVDPFGAYSAGSGCGNDTASERSMVKKYIVDSVTYWADEYHIDGFRFDLVGLIDTETVNAVVEEVHKTHPNVIFYGEGWTMSTTMTKEGYEMATQRNSDKTPNFAYFSDTIRDALRGPMTNNSQKGYASCGSGYASTIASCFKGTPSWASSPTQTVNYASCHDNLALFDRITLCTKDYSLEDQVKMNNLAAAIVMTSQGIPLFQAGEEILRSKPLPDGSYDHNSYKSPDSVNSLKWDHLNDPVYEDVYNYYKGLIAFRKAHPSLRMTTAQAVEENIKAIVDPNSTVLAFEIKGGANGEANDGMYVIFNSKEEAVSMDLPEGNWTIYINGEDAGTTPLGSASGSVTVDPISAMVLVNEPVEVEEDPSPVTFAISPLVIIVLVAAILIVAAVVVIVIIKKRKSA